MNYLQITNNNIQQMKQNEFNLIEAPTGNGKTTAIVRDLGSYCIEHGKSILYLVPRKSLEEKLNYEYHSMNDKLIKFRTYQWLGEYLNHTFKEHYDYIVFDECHTLLTNANYDINCYKLVSYINNINKIHHPIFIGLTATADPLKFMRKQGYLHKKINKIDVKTYDNSTKGKIYLVSNKVNLFKVHEKALNRGYKVINFTNDTEKLNDFKNDHNDFECACILSKYNENTKQYDVEENNVAYNSIVQNEEMNVDHLTTTTTLELGVSIKQTHNFLISFESNYMRHTIEQAKSRIRATDPNLNVDMVFQIKTKYSPIKKLEKIQKEMTKHNAMYEKYDTFENILKNQPEDSEENYEKYNHLAYCSLFYQYEFYEEQLILGFSQELFYIVMLEKMYPNKEVILLEDWDLYDLKGLIEEEYLFGFDSAELNSAEIKQFKEQLRELKLDKKNPNRVVGLSRLNKYLKESNLPYIVTSKSGRKGTKWIITRKNKNNQ